MRRKNKIILLALAVSLALCSCEAPQPAPSTPDPEPEPPDVSDPDTPTPEGYTRADSIFSINYDPDSSLNPLLGTNIYNQQLFGLVYEGLFALSPKLEPIPVLCESFDTADGQTYFFRLRQDVKFHDGSPLTPEDVAYTLNFARSSSKYSSRLEDISYVGAAEDGSVEIRLRRPNYRLPALLDVPIIKNGAADEPRPLGTGPYVMGSGSLVAFASHRDYTTSSLQAVYLKSVPDSGLADAFSDRTIDILSRDPTSSSGLNIHMIHETRYYDTSDLVYLGFNCSGPVSGDLLVRRALLRLINRDAICTDIFDNSALKSPFVISPALGLYDEADSQGYGYSHPDFRRLALVAGLEDVDFNGYLDYSAEPFTLRFIVNSESPAKVSAARRIASDMENAGIDLDLRELTYSEYVSALNSGDFDMYLGEVRLKADLDMSALFSGKLNYGKITDPQYTQLMNAYLAAPEDTLAQAARELDIFVAEDAAIIPIAYKQRTVLTHMGVVSGAAPSQSGLYNGILTWQVNLDRDS